MLFPVSNLSMNLSNTLVGVAVGCQFFATVLSRAYAGRQADSVGAKRTTLKGMLICSMAGLAYLLSALLPVPDMVRYGILIVGRLFLGLGESLLISGNFAWALGLIGTTKSGKIMSWNGMAIYGSLAAGAPLGLLMNHHFGFVALGVSTLVLPLLAFCWTGGSGRSRRRAVRRYRFSPWQNWSGSRGWRWPCRARGLP